MFAVETYISRTCFVLLVLRSPKGRRRLISKATAVNSEGGNVATENKVASAKESTSMEKKPLDETPDYSQSVLIEAPAKITDETTESIPAVPEVPTSE